MSEEENKILCIAIPTFNRAEFLDCSLEVHVPMARRYSVPIYISDNASSDDTLGVVIKWAKRYPFIRYRRNSCNLGLDGNFEAVLKFADASYIWLLGDTAQIPKNGIKDMLDLLTGQHDYEGVVVNHVSRLQISNRNYDNPNQLLIDLAGVMSCISCLIYSKRMIEEVDFSRYMGTSYVQTGIIFEYVASHKFLIGWRSDIVVESLSSSLNKAGWAYSPALFEIGLENWVNLILSLPPIYRLEQKLHACTLFGKVSGVFSIKGMLSLRAKGLLTYSSYCKYKKSLAVSVTYPVMAVALISLIPRFLLVALVSCTIFLRKSRYKM